MPLRYGICFPGWAIGSAPAFMIVLRCLLRHRQTSRAKAFCALTRKCWIPGGIRWATGMFTSGTCMNAPGQNAKERLTTHEKEASPVLKFEHARIERLKRRQDHETRENCIQIFLCRGCGGAAFCKASAGGTTARLPCV